LVRKAQEEKHFMLLNRYIGAAGALVLALVLGWVSTADARQFAMSGNWVQRRGVVYIPIAGGPVGMTASNALVTATGAGPATLTVPPSVFGGVFAIGFPLPQPSIVQITTQFSNAGPKVTGVFKAAGWVGKRPFPNFAYCPGAAANPACTDHQSTGQGAASNMGTMHGLVRYTAGPQQYGGTMQMVSGGGGVLSIRIGTNTVMHNPFGGATGAAPTEAPGGFYANSSLTDALPGGPITTGAVVSAYGMITVPGVQVNTGVNTTIINRGFSWTTGQVYVKGTTGGPVTSTTATVTGSDQRTPLGAGNITLVAGGIGNRVSSGQTFMDFDRVKMKLSHPAPSMSPAGVAVGAVLMVLAVGYALRRRF
jgi:hypothetical protein